jgi:hypothetical protein
VDHTVILATQTVQSQPGQVVCETVSLKKSIKKGQRAGGVAQGVGPEFKPQYHKKKKLKRLGKCRNVVKQLKWEKYQEKNKKVVEEQDGKCRKRTKVFSGTNPHGF